MQTSVLAPRIFKHIRKKCTPENWDGKHRHAVLYLWQILSWKMINLQSTNLRFFFLILCVFAEKYSLKSFNWRFSMCVKLAAPFYQMHQYYREGEFDSCLEKWSQLTDCMLLRTAARPRIQVSLWLQWSTPPVCETCCEWNEWLSEIISEAVSLESLSSLIHGWQSAKGCRD